MPRLSRALGSQDNPTKGEQSFMNHSTELIIDEDNEDGANDGYFGTC